MLGVCGILYFKVVSHAQEQDRSYATENIQQHDKVATNAASDEDTIRHTTTTALNLCLLIVCRTGLLRSSTVRASPAVVQDAVYFGFDNRYETRTPNTVDAAPQSSITLLMYVCLPTKSNATLLLPTQCRSVFA